MRNKLRTGAQFIPILALFILFLLALLPGPSRAELPGVTYYSEDFNYALGSNLNASANWDGTAAGEISMYTSDYYIVINGSSQTRDAAHTLSVPYAGAGSVIWVHFKVMPGIGTATMWGIWFDDASGNNLARYYGSGTSCRGRIGGTNVVTGSSTLTPGWNDLDIRINTALDTSEFFHNGISLGVLSHGSTPANAVSRIRIETIGNPEAIGHYLYLDELRIGQEPLPTEPPGPPSVTSPAVGSAVQTATPSINWTGEGHDMYEVHINTTNVPDDSDGWNSGQVSSSASGCVSGPLLNNVRYYVFVRLHNAAGWGNWSAPGHYFDVNIPLRIIPQPQQLSWKSGNRFQLNAQTRIVINSDPDEKDTFIANQLRRKIWDTTGILPEVIEGEQGAPVDNVIAVGDPAHNAAVASIISTWPDAEGKASRAEGYMLGVREGSIVIRGFDQSGTFYGCQTLIQMLEYYRAEIAPAFIYDYPDLPWRGTMVRVWDNINPSFLKEVVSEVMARFKLNVLQLDIGLGVIWPSHPELYYGLPPEEQRANPTTLDMIVPIAEWARKHFMEVIPAGGSWSHSDGLVTASTLNPLLRENRSAPDPAPGLETLCHRNPAAQQIIHDIWTDLITYFSPRYIHTGWDEVSDIGHSSCPYCAGVSKTTLFNEFLTSDRDWLAARGIQMIMWADMLRPDMNGGAPWYLSDVVATMPRDIILEDWEYLESRDNAASVARWNANGLPSLGSPYGGYNPFEVNIFNWANICDQYNNRGLVAFNKFRCGSKQAVFNNAYQWMELGNMVFYGEWGWSPGRPAVSPLPYDGKAIVRIQSSPDVASGFSASLAAGSVNLDWTNPPDSDFQAVWICYRTDRYPEDPTDGTAVADVPGLPGAHASVTHNNAPLGATLYYAAFSHDNVRHFSEGVRAMVQNGPPLSLASLTSLADGKAVHVEQAIVTGVYESFFYVEDEARANGLRIESSQEVSIGDILSIDGVLGKTGRERSLEAISVRITGKRTPPLGPLTMRNKDLGGSAKDFVPGAIAVGLNNVGLLVTTPGKKLGEDPGGGYFWITDGSSSDGVKVVLTGTRTPIAVPPGTYFCVTGVCSLDEDGKAIIRPRSQSDIVAFH